MLRQRHDKPGLHRGMSVGRVVISFDLSTPRACGTGRVKAARVGGEGGTDRPAITMFDTKTPQLIKSMMVTQTLQPSLAHPPRATGARHR